MTTSATATKNPAKAPKRHREEFDGLSLEYIEKAAVIADLFGLQDLAQDFPTLSQKTKVRQYVIAGTDMAFEHPLVPKKEEHQFDVFELAALLPYFLLNKGFPPYIFGYQGTGKTAGINQIHARLGLPLVSVILGEDSEVIDLGGQMLPTEAGGMRFSYGLLVQSMKNGWTLVFDEYDLLPTRQQKMLNGVLESGRFTIESTGEVVEAHPNWRVCAIGNTNNAGGGHSMFAGKKSGDASVNERFQFFEKHYMEKEQEKEILMSQLKVELKTHPRVRGVKDLEVQAKEFNRHLHIMESMVDLMLKISDEIRNAHRQSFSATSTGEVLNCTMSTRTLKKWLGNALALSVFFDKARDGKVLSSVFERAFKTSFINGITAEEQPIAMTIFHSCTQPAK